MSDDLNKMAIADIRPGKPIDHDPSYMRPYDRFWDYSHLLPHGIDDMYRLVVSHPKGFNDFNSYLFRKDDALDPFNKEGSVEAGTNPDLGSKGVRIHYANLKRHHRGQGIGTALYEAALAHAKHTLGATHVLGDVHSSLASAAHKRISDKHGMDYAAQPNVGPWEGQFPTHEAWNNKESQPFDDKYKGYKYQLKNELPMAKGHPTPTFPKLGLPDDRRETPIISTDLQHKMHTRAVAHSTSGHLRAQMPSAASSFGPNSYKIVQDSLMAGNGGAAAKPHPAAGGQSAPSYALGDQLIEGDWVKQHPSYAVALKLHEDVHQMFNRIQLKLGLNGRRAVAAKIVKTLPAEHRKLVGHYTKAMGGGQDPEEQIAHIVDYVNSDARRSIYHTHLTRPVRSFGFIPR
jgi:GNAT superfamily N-acetyltransferase